jgi:hypothetical protein
MTDERQKKGLLHEAKGLHKYSERGQKRQRSPEEKKCEPLLHAAAPFFVQKREKQKTKQERIVISARSNYN